MTQMKWRLNEGGGQAIYRLGVDDNGAVTGLTAKEMSASLLTLCKMSQRLGVSIRILRECTISDLSDSADLQQTLAVRRPLFNPQRKAVELHAKWKLSVNQGVSSPTLPAWLHYYLFYLEYLICHGLGSRSSRCYARQRRCWKVHPPWCSHRRRNG